MNTNVNILCYKSKTLSNGERPLMIRVCKDGKKKYQSLGISVNPAHWDFKKDITTHTTLLGWIKRYPIDSESLPLPEELIAKLQMKQSPESKEQLLQEEIWRLKKELELEKLRSHAFKRLIETAEKEEGISILKKGGA